MIPLQILLTILLSMVVVSKGFTQDDSSIDGAPEATQELPSVKKKSKASILSDAGEIIRRIDTKNPNSKDGCPDSHQYKDGKWMACPTPKPCSDEEGKDEKKISQMKAQALRARCSNGGNPEEYQRQMAQVKSMSDELNKKRKSLGLAKDCMVSFKQIGAKPSKLVVHMSQMSLDAGPLEIQKYHQQTNGWADLGYHYVIAKKEGVWKIFEGRRKNFVAAHVGPGLNNDSLGVLIAGDYRSFSECQAEGKKNADGSKEIGVCQREEGSVLNPGVDNPTLPAEAAAKVKELFDKLKREDGIQKVYKHGDYRMLSVGCKSRQSCPGECQTNCPGDGCKLDLLKVEAPFAQ